VTVDRVRTPGEQAAAARRGAGLFSLAERGLVRVAGSDRVRWLDGMVTNDVAGLGDGPRDSGCAALLLTRQGRILADLHVLRRPGALWLELAAGAVAPVLAHLERFVIADDVALSEGGADTSILGLEGPEAPAILASAAGRDPGLAPDACAEAEIAGDSVVVAAFGVSGEAAYRIFCPRGASSRIAMALEAAGRERGLVRAGAEALEILRIEAGVPLLFAELDESVLPAEAGLLGAVCSTKGCYVGQEVVARLASRGAVKHRLVGLRFEGEGLPPIGAPLEVEGREQGELTSACRSPAAGAIGLGFLRVPCDEAGTRVLAAGSAGRVAPLPFVGPRPGRS
jgi:aminomethyltransferase